MNSKHHQDQQERPFSDPADFNTARCLDEASKKPGEDGFIDQLKSDYRIQDEDARCLDEHIEREADRIVAQKFNRLIEFFEECRIPKLVVFATLTTQGSMKMTDIAENCGVSKQAVHKAFRAMEPQFRKYADGFERRRNFKLQKPNSNGNQTEKARS